MNLDAPIGIFDSGVGGLTVARAVIDQLPAERVVYVGDTAHGPYGPLAIADIRRHALAVGDSLMERGMKALVVACNTATAACLPDIRERYPVPVVEVIRPAARRAVAATHTGRIGVIGTRATIASGAYLDAFAAVRNVEVTAVACPRFVDFVERGTTSGRQVLGLAQSYLEPLQRAGVDTLVLGCTHYPLLSAVLQIVMGPDVTLVSSAEETAKDLVRVLWEAGLAREPGPLVAPHEFLATGDPEPFARLGRRFLGPEIGSVAALAAEVSRSTYLLAAGAFAVGTSAYVVAGLLPEISTDLGVTIAAAGQLTTAFALAYALGAPLLATLLGRWERRGLLVVALGTAAVGNLLSALAPAYPLLFAGRVLTALGAAAFTPAATHAATLLSPPERRGRAVAAVFTGITLSLVVGVPAGTLLGGALGYRGVFGVVAGLCVLGAVAVRVLLPTVAPPAPVGLRTRLAVVADVRVLTILGITVLGLMSVLCVYTYVAPLLAASAGVTGPVLGVLLVAYGVGALIGNDLGGRLTDRFGSRRPLLMTLPVITLTLATLPFTATSVVGAGIALFVLGGGFVVNSPVQTRLIELAPASSALVLSMNASAIYLGIGLAGVVGGVVVAGFGVLALPPVGAVLSLASLGLLLVALRHEPSGSVAV